MGLKIFWYCLFLIINLSNSEDHDMFTIFRLKENGYSNGVTTELHRQANARGLPLRTRNGFFIDSVEGMPSLECSPAIHGCAWIKSNKWVYKKINTEVDDFLSTNIDGSYYNLHGLYETCNRYNGGCEMECSMNGSPNTPTCRCFDGLIVNKANMSCLGSSSSLITRQGPFQHYLGSGTKYLYIIPPLNSTLRMYAEKLPSNYISFSYMEFPVINSPRSFQGGNITESSKIVKVTMSPRYCCPAVNGYIEFTRQHLTLDDEYGALTYDIRPISEMICVSVIYSSQSQSAEVNLNVIFKNGTNINATIVQERLIKAGWILRRFQVTLENTISSARLSLEIRGNRTTIYSIHGCSPDGNEDVSITSETLYLPYDAQIEFNRGITPKNEDKCLHGGKFNDQINTCVCPAGYTGSRCEKGCGPNHYGNNCSIQCSDFKSGCLGMIFCKPNLTCHCAAGYGLRNCTTECSLGTYGVNCAEKCGQCKGATSCDPFTGICREGCASGFYPPYCISPYSYSEFAPDIIYQNLSITAIKMNLSLTNGNGKIKYFQVQHQLGEVREDAWVEWEPEKLKDLIVIRHTFDLLPGRKYSLRVVLIDTDGSSFQGNLIPTTTFTTLCTEPTSTEYNINSSFSMNGFKIEWNYRRNTTDCPVTGYTVVLRRKWKEIERDVEDTSHNFENLLPGTEYKVKIRAKTDFGNAPFSEWYFVSTEDKAPLPVENLIATPYEKRTVNISWSPPRFTAGSLQKYNIEYQCVMHLACNDSCSSGIKMLETNKTSVLLEELQPHTIYTAKVAGVSKTDGPYSLIQFLAEDADPDTVPEMSNQPVISSTNTSLVVQWMHSNECVLQNGYFVGYHYELLDANTTIIYEGKTKDTNATFENLFPQTMYMINVYLISSGGWNRRMKISFNASTNATVPDIVQNLTVYKKGRRILGLRWSRPINIYGELTSFYVSYCEVNVECTNEISVRIRPESCSAWSDYFCHTLSHLLPNREYSISVRARNDEVDDDGFPAIIKATTSEGAPEAPLDLKMINKTYQSLTITWKPPTMFNGILRSFLINIEHIDSANTSNCCTYLPLQETPIRNELGTYIYEIVGLHPASKYSIGVSSKTISIGPSSNIIVSTPPEVPEFNPPEMMDEKSILVPAQKEIEGVTSTYLLMVLSKSENTSSVIYDPEMREKINEVVNGNFYVVDEYHTDDLPLDVTLGADEYARNGTFGILQNRALPERFRIGLALVLDYNGAKSVGFTAIEAQIAHADTSQEKVEN